MPLALEVQSLNHWTTREVPSCNYVYLRFSGTIMPIPSHDRALASSTLANYY